MSLSEDRKKIFATLKKYGRRYNADYYCVLLTPVEDRKREVGLYGSNRIALTYKGTVGAVIEGVVREVLLKPPPKRELPAKIL